jgi:hypothetical protein
MKTFLTLIFTLCISLIAIAQTHLYWTDLEQNSIERKELKWGIKQTVIPFENTPRGIAIDNRNGKIYYADGEDNTVTVANLDGTNAAWLEAFIRPGDVGLDIVNQILYVTDPGIGMIFSMTTLGHDKKALLTGLDLPRHLSLDLVRGKMYFRTLDNDRSKLYRSNLDGSELEELIDYDYKIEGIVVDADSERLFWIGRGENCSKIYCSNLDGKETKLITGAGEYAYTMTYDPVNDFIYWGEKIDRRILRVHPDGTGMSVFEDYVPEIGGLLVADIFPCQNYEMIYDTVQVFIYDTLLVSVTDTLYIDVSFTSTNQVSLNNRLRIYPNPTSEKLNIDTGKYYGELTDYVIKIISVTGQEMYSSKFSEQILELDMSFILGETGLYYIIVEDPEGKIIKTRKLILE